MSTSAFMRNGLIFWRNQRWSKDPKKFNETKIASLEDDKKEPIRSKH